MEQHAEMTIGGVAAPAEESFPVTNPATGELVGHAPRCSDRQLDEAMRAAAAAQPDWSADVPARARHLLEAAQALSAAARPIGETITGEQGKPLPMAVGEVYAAVAALRYYARLELTDEVVRDDRRARVVLTRRPHGVVAAVTPWNFPVATAVGKIAPALRAGNTVVLKPSPFTPLSTLRVGAVLREVLPPGVLNVVAGPASLGAAMVAHDTPRMVSFTGSAATGREVGARAGADLKRITLELGGNDPAILLDDVDPAAVADRLFWDAFANSGQACLLIKRLYVHESRYADVVAALAEVARGARMGDGMVPGTQMGPISTRPQFERVCRLVAAARRSGAVAVAGGTPSTGPGLFYPPTILADARDGMAVVDEEQFGPVLPVIPYRDEREAVRRANATQFGLGGSVWSADPERAGRLAAGLECGTVWVNGHAELSPGQPFGGLKFSGIGVENGRLGLHEYTGVQVRYRRHPAP